MGKFFPPPDLYNNLLTKEINRCGTVRSNRKGMPAELASKRLKLKMSNYSNPPQPSGYRERKIKRNMLATNPMQGQVQCCQL